MIVRFVVYEDNGAARRRILRAGFCADRDVDRQARPGELAMVDSSGDARPSTHGVSVVDGEPTTAPLPEIPLSVDKTEIVADGVDVARISGVPAGAQIKWPEGDYGRANGTVIEYGADAPGVYSIRFRAPLYKPTLVEITAR